ncbi:hypothetical protein DEU56DRAFT_454838 [Suillus clintonianus]|uniref:uncharacterized protein n=1 Tax=Suillus clintonianus TaxID=1904413 RepID=UPI001B88168E|nr:uncharacterized protein DEU56DRAFT_454838 [Suillus clintonianus]KAG2131689.1 hypothetical protein DEU56DRAFT_454838 [Suillus clintonianus]
MVSPASVQTCTQTSLSTRTPLNHFNALTTACILLEHIQTLERLRDETQHRVESKRQTLHFLEAITPKRKLRDALSESIVTQQQMQNTPTSTRSYHPSPRLRGLYDVHGPGCANKDSLQTTADFSPLSLVNLSIYGRDHEVVWEDDDEEALLCPSADEAVEDYAGSGDSSKESCDQLTCLVSPFHLVSSESRITFEVKEPDRVSAPTSQASHRYRSIAHGKKSPSGVKGKGVVRRGSSKRNNVGQSSAKRALRKILHHKKPGVDAMRFHE